MGKIIKLYNTWEKVKDIFVRPSLKVYFGRWRKDPNLPYWRCGPYIWLFPKKKYRYDNSSEIYLVKDSVLICAGEVPYISGNKECKTKCYEWGPKHKLPGRLKSGDYIWNRKIRKKLKKWHLSWIPPVIKLPIWTRFHIVNLDLGWKTKWDDYRYEYPPQFSIIAFGFSLSFTLHSPETNEFANDNHYWESILNYLYANKSNTLEEAVRVTGVWSLYKSKEGNKCIKFFAVRPEYINQNYLEEYYAAISKIKAEDDEVIL